MAWPIIGVPASNFPAAHERRHGVKETFLAPEQPYASGTDHLVGRGNEKVAIQILHVDLLVRQALATVDNVDGVGGSLPSLYRSYPLRVGRDAQRVTSVDNRHDLLVFGLAIVGK
jgi:hypothetical protein